MSPLHLSKQRRCRRETHSFFCFPKTMRMLIFPRFPRLGRGESQCQAISIRPLAEYDDPIPARLDSKGCQTLAATCASKLGAGHSSMKSVANAAKADWDHHQTRTT